MGELRASCCAGSAVCHDHTNLHRCPSAPRTPGALVARAPVLSSPVHHTACAPPVRRLCAACVPQIDHHGLQEALREDDRAQDVEQRRKLAGRPAPRRPEPGATRRRAPLACVRARDDAPSSVEHHAESLVPATSSEEEGVTDEARRRPSRSPSAPRWTSTSRPPL
eukprot:4218174-Prymnesium_polylepis.1